MAIFIRLCEDKFGNEKVRGKWFAKIARAGEVDITQLAERVQRNSTFKTGEVRGIIIELVEEIKRRGRKFVGHVEACPCAGMRHLYICRKGHK